MICIKVPATTANLGVGFDCLGMALDIYSYFYFKPSKSLQISGCPTEYQNENNLVYQAYIEAMTELGIKPSPIKLVIKSDIPLERGLGSSSACVVAGVLGAYTLAGHPIDQEKVLALCTKIEGHPDNVAPALIGGLVASYQGDPILYTSRFPLHSSYEFLVLIPDFRTSTEIARELLPEKIHFTDAVSNQSKLLFATQALTSGDGALLQEVMTDKLHEPYRKQLIHEVNIVSDLTKQAGALTVLVSGSGPTLLAIAQEKIDIDSLNNQLKELKHQWKCYKVNSDLEGATQC